jgi:basic membrane lipoprotein Med (substrate-binding protein (PBP1-ABC) superfamily)
VVFDFKGTYVQMVKDLEAGTFGKVYTLNVQNKGVRLLELPDDVPQEAKDKLTAVEADIVAGKIKVSAIGDAEGMRDKLKELGYL